MGSRTFFRMTCNRYWFKTYDEKTNCVKIYLVDREFHEIKGYVDIFVNLPGSKKHLISVLAITYQGLKVEFLDCCQVKDMQDHYKVLAEGITLGGLYNLGVTFQSHQAMLTTSVSTKEIWYLRYGHLNLKDLVLLKRKYMVKGLPIFKNEHVECDGCALGKQQRDEF
jgi:hypothetical protein